MTKGRACLQGAWELDFRTGCQRVLEDAERALVYLWWEMGLSYLGLHEIFNMLFGGPEPIGVTPFVPSWCVKCSGSQGEGQRTSLCSHLGGTVSSAFAEFFKIIFRTS